MTIIQKPNKHPFQLDMVAMLETDAPLADSTTRQNQDICNPPLYNSVNVETIMQLKNPVEYGLSQPLCQRISSYLIVSLFQNNKKDKNLNQSSFFHH